MENRKKIVHIDDDEAVREMVSSALSPINDLELRQFANKQEYLDSVHLEADLYILDRHFPKRPEMDCDDTSWRELTGFIGKMFPEKGVVLLTREPPIDRDWRQYENIRTVMQKNQVPQNLSYFRETIKHYLGENGKSR